MIECHVECTLCKAYFEQDMLEIDVSIGSVTEEVVEAVQASIDETFANAEAHPECMVCRLAERAEAC